LNIGDETARDEAMALIGITTPPKVQALQRTLWRQAKKNKRWRAWSLYGDLCRRDILQTAAKAVMQNAGAPGEDGMTTDELKERHDEILDQLQNALKQRTYRPGAVKRIWIPKANGKQRPLGIPNVKDRVVQAALLLLLQPIFEADFDEASYGYRPRRQAKDAIDAISAQLRAGRTEVIDADLTAYFDTIDHAQLMRQVARRVSDGSILKLVKAILRAPIVEQTREGKRNHHGNHRGTPQGGTLSPLLANLYLNGLDHGVNDNDALDAKLIRYADDFVLCCRPGKASQLHDRLKKYLGKRKLTLNEDKTRVVDTRRESFDFLGYNISRRRSVRTGRSYVHVEPGAKAQRNFRNAIRKELNHWTHHRSCAEVVRTLNRKTHGWANYYYHLHSTRVFGKLQGWLENRLRGWLWRKYDCKHAKYEFYTKERILGQYGLWEMPLKAAWKAVGEIDSLTSDCSRKAGCGSSACPV
jgi:RNA-directed DNA polymerase